MNSNTHCGGSVTWAGVIHYQYPRPYAVRAFACDDHRDMLHDPKPYGSLPEHEVEMRRRIKIIEGVHRGEKWAVDAYNRMQRAQL